MYLSSIAILFVAMVLIISTAAALPPPYVYPTESDDTNEHFDVRRSEDLASWLYRRNSALCDYRLQFRPFPLTSALCGYGHNNKGDNGNQVNPFKYG